MNKQLILVASIVICLVAALLTRRYLTTREATTHRLEPTDKRNQLVEIIVAKHDIATGAVLTIDDLGTVGVIKRAMSVRAIYPTQYSRLLGRKALRVIKMREPVLWSDIEGGE